MKCNEGSAKESSPASKSTIKVNNDSLVSCSHYVDDFGAFERHTISIGSNLMKKMVYEDKGLRVNNQGTMNPIHVVELP